MSSIVAAESFIAIVYRSDTSPSCLFALEGVDETLFIFTIQIGLRGFEPPTF